MQKSLMFASVAEAATGLSLPSCADQSERDNEVLMKAVRAGKLADFVEQE